MFMMLCGFPPFGAWKTITTDIEVMKRIKNGEIDNNGRLVQAGCGAGRRGSQRVRRLLTLGAKDLEQLLERRGQRVRGRAHLNLRRLVRGDRRGHGP